jgi:type II secretory pathway component GspD/PulD (secretin)
VTPRTWSLGVIAAIVVMGNGELPRAQEQPQAKAPEPAAAARSVTPLKVQVVLSKFQGEKKISSMPYVLSLSTNGPRVSLRMGGQVPIVTAVGPAGPGATSPITTVNYRDIGTSIDCSAAMLDGGRYNLNIGLEDSSVYSENLERAGITKASTGEQPSFNTFKVNETVILKDGESSQFTAATDKVTGQVIKVDVTLTVLK